MNRQPAAVIDKAKLPELLHEMTDSRPCCADHLYQVFLMDFGEDNLDSTSLAKMRPQEENPSWALFAGIEKPIDEILPPAFDAFPSLFITLCLTCNFEDLNLSRRVRSAVLVCLAAPRGGETLSARAQPVREMGRLPVPKTRPDHLVMRP